MRTLALAVVLIAASACSAAPSATATTARAAAASSAAATPLAKGTAILIGGITGRAVPSRDGKWIAALDPQPSGKTAYVPAVFLYDSSGTLVRKIGLPTPNWAWMPDSSGLFVALDAPQHAPSLGVVDLGAGAPRATGLLMANASLSRDGKWIVADHSEGCCASVKNVEIWIAPRTGGDTKVLARTKTDPGVVTILGIDATDGVVYRDTMEILRLPIAGGTPQRLGVSADFTRTIAGNTSPDGLAILLRGYEPLRWYIVAKAGVTLFDPSSGDIVEDRQGSKPVFATNGIWVGPHDLLVSGASGLARVDALTGSRSPIAGTLRTGDVALAYASPRLLVARGTRGLLIDTATGGETDVGIDLGTDATPLAFALPSGGFILTKASATYLSTASETFRID